MSLARRKPMPRRSRPMRRAASLRGWVPNRRPKGSRAWLVEELDRVTSLIVRRRDGRCVTCGESRPGALTCSHFYKRGWWTVRWNLTNCNCQCAVCNERHNDNPWPYTNYFLEKYGDEEMSKLFELRNVRRHITDGELEEMLDEYQAMLRKMPKTEREAA